ncbi:MAG: GNAT family N-acetyltransferase [Xanthomarina gelatinilytica]|uniref:GNAT family N-acetyltransferase n=1 Tax=Xanthomarina gelatinilytica TaxID=1137281 RepID=UPI003A8C0CC1
MEAEEEVKFRFFEKEDWSKIFRIYSEGIKSENATFFLEAPDWEQWNKEHLECCRIVAEINNEIVGWTALLPFSNRFVYKGVAEVSIYISKEYSGQKIGTKLLEKQIQESEKNGIWTLQAGIFPDNYASLKIHKNLGFRKVGYREKIGKMDKPDGAWRDTILLELRSKTIGIE